MSEFLQRMGSVDRSMAALVAACALTTALFVSAVCTASIDSGGGASSGGGAAAAQESFKTDLFTGAAQLSYPIVVPPGVNGTEPQLVLSYSSNTKATWVGHGWNLGVPSILRVSKFGTPRYDDDPETGDVFALGADRLVRDDAGTYRTMRDDFQRIERIDTDSDGFIDYWIAHDSSGRTSWYGSTAESRVQGGTVLGSASRTFAWKLSRVEDPLGNYVQYEYSSDADVGYANSPGYLARITYSFRGDTAPGSATVRSVEFEVGPRPDATRSHSGGSLQVNGSRLEEVIVRFGAALVTRYELVYKDEIGAAPPNRASLLDHVVRVGSDDSSTLPSDHYTYATSAGRSWSEDAAIGARLSELELGVAGEVGAKIGVDLTSGNWAFLDVDGDGVKDIVGTSPAYGHSDCREGGCYWSSIYLNATRVGSGEPLFVGGSVPGSGIFEGLPFELRGPPLAIGGVYFTNTGSHWVDFNGDGRTDAIAGLRNLPGEVALHEPAWSIYRNTGASWEQVTQGGYATPPDYPYYSIVCGGSYRIVGTSRVEDVNGDGLADFLVNRVPDDVACSEDLSAAGTWSVRDVYLNTGDGWQSAPDPEWSASLAAVLVAWDLKLGDLMSFDYNGDGLVDLGRDADRDGALDGADLYFGAGVGWAESSGLTIEAGLRPTDLNADGLVDHLGPQPKLGTGSQFEPASFSLPAGFGDAAAGDRVFDLDGDGEVDLVRATPGDTQVWLSASTPPDNLLVRTDFAKGATAEIEYTSSGSGSCWDLEQGGCHADLFAVSVPLDQVPVCIYPMYVDGELCRYPLQQLPLIVQVATAIEIDDRNGNISRTKSFFDLGLYDPAEREFRGFGQVTERPQTASHVHAGTTYDLGTLRVSEFYQLAFLRGALARQTVYATSDEILDPTDPILTREVKGYGVTRGDSDKTLYLAAHLDVNLACDPTLEDLLDPAASPGCPFAALEEDVYAGAIALFAPLPYAAFRAEFASPTNRDRRFAYLVTDVAALSYEQVGSTAIQREKWRWYDANGNVQGVWDWGDASDPNDDRLTLTGYAAPAPGTNGPPNLVSLPAFVQRWQVIDGGDPGTVDVELVSETRYFYDDRGTNGEVVDGLLTYELSRWEDAVNSIDLWVWSARRYAADTVGLASEIDEATSLAQTPRTTRYVYDASRSFVATQTRGDLETHFTYDPPGAPPGMGLASEVCAPARCDGAAYDVFGRKREEYAGTGSVAARLPTKLYSYDDYPGYDPARPRESVTVFSRVDGALETVLLTRRGESYADGLGRTIRIATEARKDGAIAAKAIVDTVFDIQGNVAATTRPYFEGEPLFATQMFYDARGRSRFVVLPNGSVQETRYEGLVTTRIDPEGRVREVRTNGVGDIVETIEHQDAGPQLTRYRYDGLGRLVLVCDPLAPTCDVDSPDSRHATALAYDSLGRVVRVADPDRGTWRYEYDAKGRVLRQTDARGVEKSFVYDSVYGRLQETYEDGVRSLAYVYGDTATPSVVESMGRIVRAEGPHVTYDYQWSPLAYIARKSATFATGEVYATELLQNTLGGVLSVAHPDGEAIVYQYDESGLEGVFGYRGEVLPGSFPPSPTDPASTRYLSGVQRDAALAPTRYVLGNGATRRITYDDETGSVTQLRDWVTGLGNVINKSYVYDLTGKVISIDDGLDAAESLGAVAYDAIGRLTDAVRGGSQVLHYEYDVLGNLTSKNGMPMRYEHPSKPHALFDGANAGAHDYDANGNMVRRNGETLAYGPSGFLESVSGGLGTRFGVDHSGQRVFKQHGADVSQYLGADLEIKNGVRLVKTLRMGPMIVARVERDLRGPSNVRTAPAMREYALASVGGLLMLLVVGGAMLPPTTRSRAERALASGLAGFLVLSSALPPVARAAQIQGDLQRDGVVGIEDVLLMQRVLSGRAALDWEAELAADVAPLNAGDGEVNAGDAVVLMRGLSEWDADGDGLSLALELALGLSPTSEDSDRDGVLDFDEDSDRDGLTNAVEIMGGTDPALPDSDGDGWLDGTDPSPLTAAADEAVWIHGDHLGSSSVLTAEDGSVVRRIFYDIWGGIRESESLATPPVFEPAETFTGQRLDRETGLMHYGSRYYDPSLGRFIQPDAVVPSIFRLQALNPYSYVENDPLNRIDPTGHSSGWAGSAWGAVTSWASSAWSAVSGWASSAWSSLSRTAARIDRAISTSFRRLRQHLANRHWSQRTLSAMNRTLTSVGQSASAAADLVIAGTAAAIEWVETTAKDVSAGIGELRQAVVDAGGEDLYDAMVAGFVPGTNDMKILHAANAFRATAILAAKLSGSESGPLHYLARLLVTPFVALIGVGYEIKTGFGFGHGSFDNQPILDWLWDTPGDLVANTFGQVAALLIPNNEWASQAIRITQVIPGPDHTWMFERPPAGFGSKPIDTGSNRFLISPPGGPNGIPQ